MKIKIYFYFINKKEVSRRTSLCASTIRDLINRGKFPKSVQVTVGRVAWVSSEVDAWIAAKNRGEVDFSAA